jgi:phospholipid-binding lipoprotein MlaA
MCERVPNMKMISSLFLLITLSFVFFAPPCSADPSSSEPEPFFMPWQAPAATVPIPLAANEEICVDTPGDGPEPLQPTIEPSPSSPAERAFVLWQSPTHTALSDSSPSSDVSPSSVPPDSESHDEEEESSSDTSGDTTAGNGGVPDPLEPVNRIFFQFNDKFYFWLLKPVATGYNAVFSEDFRVCFRNVFSNLTTPIRLANSLLQGRFKGAGNELFRFALNTTFGFFGCYDQAKDKFQVDKEDRDTGQTLGKWGFPPLLYIEWPILGPSNVRDTFGFVGDWLLDPRTYFLETPVSMGVKSFQVVNDTSLRLGDYEDLKKAALDPYVAKRDAYQQYRQNKIKKK